VVHFRADDCSACDGVASILAQLVDGCAGRLPLTEVDVHAQPGLADRYNIRLTPTILLIRDGAVVDRVVGAATQAPAAEPDRRESAPARRLTARPPGGRVPRLMVDLRPRPLYGPGMGLCRP
jgi:thiol-disulfide isomerase/thioredoxin